MKPEHGPERPVQVKGIIFRLWLKFGRYFPLDRSRHRRGPSVLISYDNAATVRRYPALVKKLGGRQDRQALSVPQRAGRNADRLTRFRSPAQSAALSGRECQFKSSE